MLHDPSTVSARDFSSDFFSYDVRQRIADLQGLSPVAYTVYRRLEEQAVLRGGHLSANDEKLLSRLAGVTVTKLRVAFLEIWEHLGERLCSLADSVLSFVLAQKECDFRARKSSANRANANARWKAKSLKDNDTADATASFSHMPNECPTTSTTKEPKGSPYSPQGGRGFGFPDLDEVLRATTEPDPSPASEAAKPSSTEKRARARATAGDPEFDAFWAEMPEMARKRASKPETLKQWKLLTPGERAQARTVIPVWAEDGKYAKGAHRWLKLRMWESLVGQKPKPDRTKEDRECEMMY